MLQEEWRITLCSMTSSSSGKWTRALAAIKCTSTNQAEPYKESFSCHMVNLWHINLFIYFPQAKWRSEIKHYASHLSPNIPALQNILTGMCGFKCLLVWAVVVKNIKCRSHLSLSVLWCKIPLRKTFHVLDKCILIKFGSVEGFPLMRLVKL